MSVTELNLRAAGCDGRVLMDPGCAGRRVSLHPPSAYGAETGGAG
jgi:hypothetical protein